MADIFISYARKRYKPKDREESNARVFEVLDIIKSQLEDIVGDRNLSYWLDVNDAINGYIIHDQIKLEIEKAAVCIIFL